ncbi:MAG: amidotransferase [Chitinophagaceae bacterium]|nr:amidotransferase [Chitinophagaceae bacterium]
MGQLRIHYFQHVPFEDLGYIETWCSRQGHTLTSTQWFEGASLPELTDIDWLIVMGGPMGVYDNDTYTWLDIEKAFIKQSIDAGKIVIGICLGAQLIASALGAKVYPNTKKEIGWFPVQLTERGKRSSWFYDFPEAFTVLHWHGDTFDLPDSAQLLAKTGACLNQAFAYHSNVLALQFHFETTKQSLSNMIQHCRQELVKAEFIQTEDELENGAGYIPAANNLLEMVLNKAVLLTKQ